jgi:hypothetical protein
MDNVETKLKAIPSVADTRRRPTTPTDKDSAKLPLVCFSYGPSTKRKNNRIQFVEFDLQFEATIKRSSTSNVESVGEAILADIEAMSTGLEGQGPCVIVTPKAEDILYYDENLDFGMAIAIYGITLAHDYGNQYAYSTKGL